MNMEQLKKQASEQQGEKLDLTIKKINKLKEIAENRIRSEQREIGFETKEYTVELAVKKYSDNLDEDKNELFVPDYQREFVWDLNKQSKLIESLLIGLPIPYIFTADVLSDDPDEDGRIEIVDGSQRIRTLHAFCSNQLILCHLQKLKELNGFKFEDLSESRQRRFLRIPIRFIELSAACSEESRRDLFERINTGSDILKDMEVRTGSKYGSSEFFTKVLIPCSDNKQFLKLAPMTEAKMKRKEPLELVLRFFAYLNNYENFSKSVVEFLNSYLEESQNLAPEKLNEMVDEFNRMLSFVDEYFPNGFGKTPQARSTPRVRFEALSVGVALALQENTNLVNPNLDWLDSNEFLKHTTSDASNSRPRVIQRIEYVRNKLLGEE